MSVAKGGDNAVASGKYAGGSEQHVGRLATTSIVREVTMATAAKIMARRRQNEMRGASADDIK